MTTSVTSVASTPKQAQAANMSYSFVTGRVFALYRDAMGEGAKVVKDIVKLISYGTFWYQQYTPSASAAKLNADTRHMKNLMSAVAVPDGIAGVAEKVDVFFKAPSWHNMWEVIGKATGLVTDLADTYDFASAYASFPKDVSTWVTGVSYGSTIIGCGKSAVEQIASIQTHVGQLSAPVDAKASAEQSERTKAVIANKLTLNLINLASKVAYVALASVALTFLIAGVATPVTFIVSCLTVATVLSVGAYFFERIVDPEGKAMRRLTDLMRPLVATSSAPSRPTPA